MQTKSREAGVDLIKIFAIFIIVLFHCSKSVTVEGVGNYPFCLDLTKATTNIQYIILMLFMNLGVIGNNIFFISSAWFLCDRKTYNFSKTLQLTTDSWFISVIFLGIFILAGVNISSFYILQSFFPIMAQNNWYISCYIILYAAHPLLNKIIEQSSKQAMFSTAFISFLFYFVINMFCKGLYYYNPLINFVTMYFIVAYIKKYGSNSIMKKNFVRNLFLIGLLGLIIIQIAMNYIGLYIPAVGNNTQYLVNQPNPFLLFLSLSIFLFSLKLKIKSPVINKIAALSFLVYIIHDNKLFRTYWRPLFYNYIYNRFGYNYILLLVLLYTILIFAGSIIIAMVYKKVIGRISINISSFLYGRISSIAKIIYNSAVKLLY